MIDGNGMAIKVVGSTPGYFTVTQRPWTSRADSHVPLLATHGAI